MGVEPQAYACRDRSPAGDTCHSQQGAVGPHAAAGRSLYGHPSSRTADVPFRKAPREERSARHNPLPLPGEAGPASAPLLHTPPQNSPPTWWRCPKKAWACAVEIAPPTGTGCFWKSRPFVCVPRTQAEERASSAQACTLRTPFSNPPEEERGRREEGRRESLGERQECE